MQFEYDPECLITEVSKRPGLWDYQHPDYRAKKVRVELWGEVVKELMQTDVTMSKGEMRELELQLQKKWKSIRDCFQKYIANPNRTKRPYLYCKQLQFLLKDQKLTKRSTSAVAKEDGSSESAEDEEYIQPKEKRENRNVAWKPRKRLKLSKTDDGSEDDNNDTFEVVIDDYDSSRLGTSDNKANVSHNIDNNHFAFASVDNIPKDSFSKDGEDPDKMFLLSLLPHLKSLPEEFRLNAKMELMQVLQQANYSVSKLI